MKIYTYIMLLILACVFAGCATPRSEPLPAGPKGESILALSQSLQTDESPTIRVASALALGKIGSKYPDQELAAAMWNDPSIQVKVAAIRSLGQIGGPNALQSLNEYSAEYAKWPGEKVVTEELKSAIEKAEGAKGSSK